MAVDDRLIASVQNQMLSDPAVQQAYQRYRANQSQPNFIAWINAARPYYDQVKATGYGLDPATGQFHKPTSSTKGAITKSILIPAAATVSGGMAISSLASAPAAVSPAASAAAPAAATTGLGAVETAGTVNVGAGVGADVAAASAGAGFDWGTLAKYGASIGGKAIDAYQSKKQADQRAEAERTRQAVTESQLDPFRGFMDQAHDAGRLDWMANQDLTSSPVQLDPKYGAGITPRPTRDYGPSLETRALLRAASSRIAGGDTAPAITPGTQPLPVVRRRKNPNVDDPNSWLYE